MTSDGQARIRFKQAAAEHFNARASKADLSRYLFLRDSSGSFGGVIPDEYQPYFPELSSEEIVSLPENAATW